MFQIVSLFIVIIQGVWEFACENKALILSFCSGMAVFAIAISIKRWRSKEGFSWLTDLLGYGFCFSCFVFFILLFQNGFISSMKEEKADLGREKAFAEEQLNKAQIALVEKDNLLAKMPTKNSGQETAAVPPALQQPVEDDSVSEPKKAPDAVEETNPDLLAQAVQDPNSPQQQGKEISPQQIETMTAQLAEMQKEVDKLLSKTSLVPGIAEASGDLAKN